MRGIGHLRVLGGQGPGPGLLLGIVQCGARPGSPLGARDGLVELFLGGNRVVIDGAHAGQGAENRPAAVLVDLQAHRHLLIAQPATDQRDSLGGVNRSDECVGERQLVLRAGFGLLELGGDARHQGAVGLLTVGRRGVGLRGSQCVAQLGAHGRHVGLRPDAAGDRRDVLVGGQLGIAVHVPHAGPHHGPGQRIGQLGDVLDRGVQGLLVEADLGVAEVLVVEQHQDGTGLAHQGVDRRALTAHIEFEGRGAHELPVAQLIATDPDVVGAQRRMLHRSGLDDVEAGEGPRVVHLDLRAQGVDAAGLQPLLGEAVKVLAGRLLQRTQQVGELGVRVGMFGEVLAHAGEEVLFAHVGDQLLQHRGALGIGDAVEALVNRLQVNHVGRDRMGRGHLVLHIGPALTGIGEADPRVDSAEAVDDPLLGEVAAPFGEALIEPQVVPPAHGHQVAEPHVRQLMEDGVVALLVVGRGHLRAVEVLVADRHRAGILHGAGVVLGHEQLVVLREGIGAPEGLLIDLEAPLGGGADAVGVQVLGHRLAADDVRAELALRGRDRALVHEVLTGDQCGDVGGDGGGRLEVPALEGRGVRGGRGRGR